MKLKAFYIVLSSLILFVSLVCLVLEYLKLKKSRAYDWRTNSKEWENSFFSASIAGNDDDLDYRRSLDVVDLKYNRINIFGRLRISDKLKVQKDGIDIARGGTVSSTTDHGAIKDSVGMVDTSEKWPLEKSLPSKNEQPKDDANDLEFSQNISQMVSQTKSSEGIIAEQDNKQPNENLINNANIELGTAGFLNVHIWDNICNFNLNSLKEHILFPALPTIRKVVNNTDICDLSVPNSGVRIFGFLEPDETGTFRFGISSSGNAELWLSNSTNALNKKKLAYIGNENEPGISKESVYDQFSTQTSHELHLIKGSRYFIEVLYKHTTGQGRVQVAWMTPQSTIFEGIPGTSLITSINDHHVNHSGTENFDRITVNMSIKGFYKMTFMDFIDFEKAFPFCEYEPSYYMTEKLVRFQGARNKNNTHFADVYPADGTNETLPLVKKEDTWWTENNYGNSIIDNTTVENVWKIFTDAFEKVYEEDFKVVDLLSMERVVDQVKGSRYHLQVKVEDVYSGSHHEFSEYLYQPKGSGSLCFPRGFRWNKHTDVNIIVPIKDSGRWALAFIKNIAAIINKTLDPHIRLIIVDYTSNDIDMEAVLKHARIIRYTIVPMPSDKVFNRAEALQRGADAVKDPYSILFMCDLHLIMPVTLIETIRKHCVEGKMAFAPVVKRLKCGYYPSKPKGYWETLGFGLFALYKSDFERIGGMSVNEFQGWGGEDWELLDRVLESRIEVERIRIPSFYHFFHPAYGGEKSRIDA